jgi:hypothetical protein
MHDHSNMDHSMMDHSHHTEPESTQKEYAKFIAVILGIVAISHIAASLWGGLTHANLLRMFMGVFFLVFGMFKLLDLRGFAMSYMGYDIIAKRFMPYAYVYPFIEIALALGYFFSVPYTEWVTLVVMIIGSIGVFKELMRGSKIKCACLGTYIKLPLTTVSLVEDVAMGVMALLMILRVF